MKQGDMTDIGRGDGRGVARVALTKTGHLSYALSYCKDPIMKGFGGTDSRQRGE